MGRVSATPRNSSFFDTTTGGSAVLPGFPVETIRECHLDIQIAEKPPEIWLLTSSIRIRGMAQQEPPLKPNERERKII
jgi:hypothetical protein